jgi:Carboxypeptidase regulatory-like domain/TonB-dependent Receptor Plug Domain
MNFQKYRSIACVLTLIAGLAVAQTFATVRGTVVDPQQLALPNAHVLLKSETSAWTAEAQTGLQGDFLLQAVPAGSYTIEIKHDDFQTVTQMLNVVIGSAPVLKFPMELATATTTAEVTAQLDSTNPEESSPPVMVNIQDILHTPGADRANSLAFITNFVPGTYMLHDHIHMRGGHQVSWLVDGVPVPNTNLSSNVSRILDPKDMETVEVSRGGYSARYGDRTYGVINVIPRSGFEFENEGELTLGYGSYNQANAQLSVGGHSNKFAYYLSATGNRTDLGLEPPAEQVLHNNGNGFGTFASLSYNATDRDQFRLSISARRDRYQIPNTPEDQALGFRAADQERDAFVNLSWVHTYGPGTLLTISPFYHNNRGEYLGGLNDPLITTSDRTSRYSGAQIVLGLVRRTHNIHVGTYGYYQSDDALFGLASASPKLSVTSQQPFSGNLSTIFLDDQYKPWTWLTLNGGVRLTHSATGLIENAASPRIGSAVQIPHLKWVLRGFYGRYYQPPPLSTIAGPLLDFALQRGFGFLPLRGERDQQREFGLTIPIRNWILDLSNFRTNASNFGDHDVLGNSNLSLPLTVQSVRVRGWEATVRSPQVLKRARFHLALSDQTVQGRGAITGGMTAFQPPETAYFYIDHDQRVTLTGGGEVTLPRRAWFSSSVEYGSGFLDRDGPAHLPQHVTGSFSMGKSFGERWSASLSALNVANSRYLLGRASSFAGTHFNDPRQIMAEVHYRFRL